MTVVSYSPNLPGVPIFRRLVENSKLIRNVLSLFDTTLVSYTPKLPNEPIFRRLVENSKSIRNVIIHDPSCGVDATYVHLLRDILALRQRLYECLPVSMFDEKGRIKEDAPYILILSRGTYEFIVASFSILAIGGALVPLGELMKTFLHRYFDNH